MACNAQSEPGVDGTGFETGTYNYGVFDIRDGCYQEDGCLPAFAFRSGRSLFFSLKCYFQPSFSSQIPNVSTDFSQLGKAPPGPGPCVRTFLQG